MPYAIIHDGLLMPLFGCIVLGLAGNNPLAYALGWRPLVFVGEASYCLYLLHFNLWNLIHDSHFWFWSGLSRFDPWLSYMLLIGLGLWPCTLLKSRPSASCAAGCTCRDDGILRCLITSSRIPAPIAINVTFCIWNLQFSPFGLYYLG